MLRRFAVLPFSLDLVYFEGEVTSLPLPPSAGFDEVGDLETPVELQAAQGAEFRIVGVQLRVDADQPACPARSDADLDVRIVGGRGVLDDRPSQAWEPADDRAVPEIA